jgi:hypothetical protein
MEEDSNVVLFHLQLLSHVLAEETSDAFREMFHSINISLTLHASWSIARVEMTLGTNSRTRLLTTLMERMVEGERLKGFTHLAQAVEHEARAHIIEYHFCDVRANGNEPTAWRD